MAPVAVFYIAREPTLGELEIGADIGSKLRLDIWTKTQVR